MRIGQDNSFEEEAITMIVKEYVESTIVKGLFHSAHEGFAVIHEEFDELKAEVWKKVEFRDPEAMVTEAKQLGAMAMRFLVDVAIPALNRKNRVPTIETRGSVTVVTADNPFDAAMAGLRHLGVIPGGQEGEGGSGGQ